MMNTIITAFITGFVGGVIGHKFTLNRDGSTRKRHFLGFLKQWQVEIAEPEARAGSSYDAQSEAAYRAKVPTFLNEVERVRDVLGNRSGFDTLTMEVGSLSHHDWKNQNPSAVILTKLQELIRLVT